jgi:hypothetical protein
MPHLRRRALSSLSFSPRRLTRHRATNLGLVAAVSLSFALISAQAFACDLSEPQKGALVYVVKGHESVWLHCELVAKGTRESTASPTTMRA